MAMAPDCRRDPETDGRLATRVAALLLANRRPWCRVPPGERLPLDGTVLAARVRGTQAPINRRKPAGLTRSAAMRFFAGTINQSGALEIRVTAARSQKSTLAQIIKAVEEARLPVAPINASLSLRGALHPHVFSSFALAVALLTPALLGFTHPRRSTGLVLLVIACPLCAGDCHQSTVVSGLAAAPSRHHHQGRPVHRGGRKIKVLALHKTGTITLANQAGGLPSLSGGMPTPARFNSLGPAAWPTSLRHPVSRAIGHKPGRVNV